MSELHVNPCLTCLGSPEMRAFGASDHVGVGRQTAIIECACGQKVERIAAEEESAMPAVVAAWNAANTG